MRYSPGLDGNMFFVAMCFIIPMQTLQSYEHFKKQMVPLIANIQLLCFSDLTIEFDTTVLQTAKTASISER
jgi:hypothetical protein